MHDGNRLTQALLFENVLRFFDQHYPDSQDECGIQTAFPSFPMEKRNKWSGYVILVQDLVTALLMEVILESC